MSLVILYRLLSSIYGLVILYRLLSSIYGLVILYRLLSILYCLPSSIYCLVILYRLLSSIYSYWLPLWYIQHLFTMFTKDFVCLVWNTQDAAIFIKNMFFKIILIFLMIKKYPMVVFIYTFVFFYLLLLR